MTGQRNSIKAKASYLIIRKIIPGLFYFVFYFIPRKEKKLLIIKNDGIGDYILFRNYIEFIKNSEKFQHHKIYILGNLNFKDLALHLDSKTISGFLWYSDSFFIKWKFVRLLFDLQYLRLTDIIYTNYSRKYIMDSLISKVRATRKFAIDGNLVNESAELKQKGDTYYTQLIEVDHGMIHEFDRNKEIVEIFTGEKCDIRRPLIEKNRLNIAHGNKIVVFTGASDVKRKWSAVNYNRLCRTIISNSQTGIVLAGGKDEIKDGFIIMQGISPEHLSNQIGQISLTQLCELIGGASLLISSDTVAIHIAAALGISTVCISKGDLYGRFIPYPAHISDRINTVFPKHFSLAEANYDRWSTLDINDITVEDVYAVVENTMKYITHD